MNRSHFRVHVTIGSLATFILVAILVASTMLFRSNEPSSDTADEIQSYAGIHEGETRESITSKFQIIEEGYFNLANEAGFMPTWRIKVRGCLENDSEKDMDVLLNPVTQKAAAVFLTHSIYPSNTTDRVIKDNIRIAANTFAQSYEKCCEQSSENGSVALSFKNADITVSENRPDEKTGNRGIGIICIWYNQLPTDEQKLEVLQWAKEAKDAKDEK